jgi:hypothetical protein
MNLKTTMGILALAMLALAAIPVNVAATPGQALTATNDNNSGHVNWKLWGSHYLHTLAEFVTGLEATLAPSDHVELASNLAAAGGGVLNQVCFPAVAGITCAAAAAGGSCSSTKCGAASGGGGFDQLLAFDVAWRGTTFDTLHFGSCHGDAGKSCVAGDVQDWGGLPKWAGTPCATAHTLTRGTFTVTAEAQATC